MEEMPKLGKMIFVIDQEKHRELFDYIYNNYYFYGNPMYAAIDVPSDIYQDYDEKMRDEINEQVKVNLHNALYEKLKDSYTVSKEEVLGRVSTAAKIWCYKVEEEKR